MDSLGRAVVILVLAIVLAGCGGTDGEGDQSTPTATGGNGGTGDDDNETEEAPPEPQELLNETLDYARAPEEMGESANFDVPPETVGLRFTYQGEHDCPTPSLGYQDDAQVVFVDPNGEEYRENLFDSGAGSVDCNNPPTRHIINPDAPVAGSWEVRAEGVYTGMVHVTALANPPGSSA